MFLSMLKNKVTISDRAMLQEVLSCSPNLVLFLTALATFCDGQGTLLQVGGIQLVGRGAANDAHGAMRHAEVHCRVGRSVKDFSAMSLRALDLVGTTKDSHLSVRF